MGTTWLIWIALAVIALHAALALLSQRLERRAERAHPPVGAFVVDGDVKAATPAVASAPRALHFRDGGPRDGAADAPVVVLVHGASTSLLDFETSLRPPLETRYRVVSVDRPGSGWSAARAAAAGDPRRQAAAVVEVLDALGIERAVWVGHSWGGAVVMAALLDHPERVVGGVAIAAATHPWEGPLPRVIRLTATPLLGHVLAASWIAPLGRRVLDDAVADSFKPEPPPDDLDGYLRATGAPLTVRGDSFRATALDLVGLQTALAEMAPRYASITRPLLLVNGDADPVIPPERHADRVAEQLTAARTERVAGAGHILHHTRTAQIVSAILAFVARHDAREPSQTTIESHVPSAETAAEKPPGRRTDERVAR